MVVGFSEGQHHSRHCLPLLGEERSGEGSGVEWREDEGEVKHYREKGTTAPVQWCGGGWILLPAAFTDTEGLLESQELLLLMVEKVFFLTATSSAWSWGPQEPPTPPSDYTGAVLPCVCMSAAWRATVENL